MRFGRVEPFDLIVPVGLDGKFHIDGWGAVIVVFDFRLRQSGPALSTPMNRLESLVHHALLDEFGKFADNGRLV